MSDSPVKILILRFSSYGDILATSSVVKALSLRFSGAEIHWLTRADFASAAELSPQVRKIWSLPSARKQKGIRARWQQFLEMKDLADKLRREEFTHIYDAHNMLRSQTITFLIRGPLGIFSKALFLRKSQYRLKRILLFRFRINLYPKPFTLQRALLEPLQKWGIPLEPPQAPVLGLPRALEIEVKQKMRFADPSKPTVVVGASASYVLKRWPVKNFIDLVKLRKDLNFVLLGGAEDLFIREITENESVHCKSLAGQLDYAESCAAVFWADAVLSNDTGVMHAAEQLDKPCVALMGPAPFGVPCRSQTLILERDLSCRPCSKHGQGPCTNSVYQKCLVDISVLEVSEALNRALKMSLAVKPEARV